MNSAKRSPNWETELPAFSVRDTALMADALKLARKGRFTTTPNPNVGCIITDAQGDVVGEGWHHKAGTPHAEVHALRQAGEKARGGTAYVTLEPCSHYGRTPPCAEALIKAGVARVVAAVEDPNPQVAGRGLSMLVKAGIEVSSGLLQEEALTINRGFISRMTRGRPFVTLKLAASLDGKTALNNGDSQWITGPLAREDVQRHRAEHCAILSGSGTVLADNPSLNVRYEELGCARNHFAQADLRQPLRVILDGRNQLGPTLRMFGLPGTTLVVNKSHHAALPKQVEQWQAPVLGNKLALTAVLQELGNRHINSLWVEAGGRMAGALLKENLVDELILYIAPKLMGHDSQGLFNIPALTQMHEAYALQWKDVRQIGDDLKITARVKTAPQH